MDDVRILGKECASIIAAGYEVTLIGRKPLSAAPSDQPGLKLRILPVPGSRAGRIAGTLLKALSWALAERASLYHLHDPELLLIAPLLRLTGAKVVYDAHEDLPLQILSKLWISERLRPMAAKAAQVGLRMLVPFTQAVVAATPGVAARFPPAKTVTVNNFPRLDLFTPENEVAVRQNATAPVSNAAIAYVGGITRDRGLFDLLKALEVLPANLGVRLKLAGKFDSPELRLIAEGKPGWGHVDFLGWVNARQISDLLSECVAGVVALHPTQAFIESQPLKMFEYMAAGLPVIASDFPLWRDIVERHECGLLIDPQDPQAIAGAIRWVVENPEEAAKMGARGQAAVQNTYNWSAEESKLLELYKRLIGPPEARS